MQLAIKRGLLRAAVRAAVLDVYALASAAAGPDAASMRDPLGKYRLVIGQQADRPPARTHPPGR